MKIQTRVGIVALLAMVLSFGAIAGAQDSSGQEERSATEAEVLQQGSPEGHRAASAPNPNAIQGLRTVKDPGTGKLRPPTRSEAGALGAANRSSAGLRQFRLPKGGFGVNLQGRFRSSSIALKGPDGAIAVRCTPNTYAERGLFASGGAVVLAGRDAADKGGP